MQVKLSVKDIETILNTLVYDDKVERKPSGDKNLYRSIQPLVNLPGLMKSPCGLCPVRYITNKLRYNNHYKKFKHFLLNVPFFFFFQVKKQCCDKGTFTSINCQYITEWLE